MHQIFKSGVFIYMKEQNTYDPKCYSNYRELMTQYICHQYEENAPAIITDEMIEAEYQMMKREGILHYVKETNDFFPLSY
jgi:hypothetical protein